MARAQGIDTKLLQTLATISNGLVGLSGALYAQYQGAADVNMGRGAIVIGLLPLLSEMYCLENCVQERNWHLHIRCFP